MLEGKEQALYVRSYMLVEKIKCNTREYVANVSIWKVLQAAKRRGKRSGRGRSATLETQQTFLTNDSRSAMLR